MSEHELKISYPNSSYYLGECQCGWTQRRSRARDLKREFRKHVGKPAVNLPPRDHTFTPIDGERE